MKNFLSLIFLIFAVTYANSQTADSIISKAIDAIGGENALKNINTIEYNMTLTGKGIDMSMIYIKKANDKIRVEINTDDENVIFIMNGKTGWLINSDKVDEVDEDDLDELKKQYENLIGVFNTYDYINKEKNTTFKLIEEEQVNGIATYKIEATTPDIDYTLYIDKVTFLLVKMSTVRYIHQHFDDNNFKEPNFFDLYFSDYKSVGLIKMPHKVEQKINVGVELITN